MRAVRVVHVTTSPLALCFLRGQVGYMRERGFDVLVVSSKGEQQEWFRQSEGIAVHTVEMSRRITPVRDLLAVARLYRYFRHVRPDIVHAHTPKAGLVGTVAAWLARVPVRIYHLRGLPLMTATGSRRILLRLSETVACALAERVLCVSHGVREVAVRAALCREQKMTVPGPGSGNGIDGQRFDPVRWKPARSRTRAELGIPPDAIVIGFIGRIVRDKGIHELAVAWTALRTEFPGLHLVVVGHFEAEDPLPPAMETRLRTDARVHLTGGHPDPAPLYAGMDLVILPTYREGLPNVPLEAAAMALPVVATRIPGCTEAVRDGVTGVLVPPRDAGALADAIRGYIRDPALRQRHGAAGRAWVLRQFRPESVWDALYLEYVRLLAEKRIRVDPGVRRAPPAFAAVPALLQEQDDSFSAGADYRRHAHRTR